MRSALMVAVMLLLIVTDSDANFYKYRDSNGAVVITDKLENIPPKYRKKYQVIWDKDLESRDPLARRKAAARAEHERLEREKQSDKAAGKRQSSDGKRLVISVDEETGQIIRRME